MPFPIGFTLFFALSLPSLALGADASGGILDCLQKTSDFSDMSDQELLRLLKGVRGFTNDEEFIALETRRQLFTELTEKVRSEHRAYTPGEIKIYGETLLEILKLSRVAYKLNDNDPNHIIVEILPVPFLKHNTENYVHPLNRFAWGLSQKEGTTLALDFDPNRKLLKQYSAAHDPAKKLIIASNDMVSDLLPSFHEGHEVIHSLGGAIELGLIAQGKVPSTPRMLTRHEDAGDDGFDYVKVFWNDEASAHAYTLSYHSADLARWAKRPDFDNPKLQTEVEKKLLLGIRLTSRIKRRLERSEDQLQEALVQVNKLSAGQLLGQRLKSNPDGTCTLFTQVGRWADRSLTFYPSKALEKAIDAIERLPNSDVNPKIPFRRPSAQAEGVRLEVVRALTEELKTELTAVQRARRTHQAAFTYFQQRLIGREFRVDSGLIEAFRKPYQDFNELRRKDREHAKLGE